MIPVVDDERSAPVIQVTALTKFYKSHRFFGQRIPALDGVSFNVGAGKIVGIVGPNGSGKTTIFKILLGLCPPSSGEARLFRLPPNDPNSRRKVGYVPEETVAPNFMRVIDVMNITGHIFGIAGIKLKSKVDELITLSELNSWKKIEVSKLSKGMKRKLAFAQALINESAIKRSKSHFSTLFLNENQNVFCQKHLFRVSSLMIRSSFCLTNPLRAWMY